MKNLNPLVQSMPRSGIRMILDEASKYDDVIHLEIGQPNFPTPSHIVDAAARAAYDGFVGYTPNAGYLSLREAFAERLNENHLLKIQPEQVVISVGAMGALFNAFCALISYGDEVLIPDPGYPNYLMPIQLLGGKAIRYSLDEENGFTFNIDNLLPLITDKTKVVVINSPSNPTGSVVGETQIVNLIQLALKRGFYILSDESYDRIIFEGSHITPLKFSSDDHIIGIYSCSKSYSMTGWRVGCMVTSPALVPLMAKIQEMYVSCAPSVSQKAAEAALRGSQSCVIEMVNEYKRRRDIALETCNILGLKHIIPKGAFYVMIGIPEFYSKNSMDLALELIRDGGVALAPGMTFGPKGERYLRASLCVSEKNLRDGIIRLGSYYNQIS